MKLAYHAPALYTCALRCLEEMKFRSEKCEGFLEHWRSLRQDGELFPAQTALFDNPHPAYAPHLHVAEMLDGELVFRLMGTALVERWGRDKTGEKVGDGQPSPIRSALYDNSRTAYALPCGFRQIVEFAATNGSEMAIESVVLPLAVASDKPPRLVSFSDLLQTMKFGEHSNRYLGLPEVEWVDIGAGLPAGAPVMVERL